MNDHQFKTIIALILFVFWSMQFDIATNKGNVALALVAIIFMTTSLISFAYHRFKIL